MAASVHQRSRKGAHSRCCKLPETVFELVCRPAFQAIIEALHQQMQQHLAAEKAAAAAASAAASKRVSPFGAMSNLMKVRTCPP